MPRDLAPAEPDDITKDVQPLSNLEVLHMIYN